MQDEGTVFTSLKFAGVGFVAMFVVANIDAIVDCVGCCDTASTALCHFPGQY